MKYMLHISLQMNRTAVVVHKLMGKTDDLALKEEVNYIINVKVISAAQVSIFLLESVT